MESLWSQTCRLPEYKTLEGDLRAKNVVIGAGMAGLLIAYMLQEKGCEVIVLEANKVASGQTKNTTAKITSQHGLIYSDMIKNTGMERAAGYAKANERAIQLYKEIMAKEGIACDFREIPSFLYTKKREGIEKLKKETVAAKQLGISAEYLQGNQIEELPFGVMGAVRFVDQAQFHPLKFIEGIAKKLTIYENAKVLEVDEHFVITEKGVVVADHIIFAAHYPFVNEPGYYFLRQHQSRSYVLALTGEGVPQELDGVYYGIDKDGLSFRCAEGRLLLGGGSHRVGRTEKGGFGYLRKQAQQYYPNAKEETYWAAQDCMPHDRIPFIGRFSFKREYWYVATGFQKWGMTTAMVAAMLISDQILGRKNRYEEVFSPQRFLAKASAKNFAIDAGESTKGLVQGKFAKKSKTCTHLGCALHWNEEEECWECGCHGSRFDKEGHVLDGPAQTDIEK